MRERIIRKLQKTKRNPESQTCAAMNFGLMKQFPVTIPLLAFRRILQQHADALQT